MPHILEYEEKISAVLSLEEMQFVDRIAVRSGELKFRFQKKVINNICDAKEQKGKRWHKLTLK